MSKYLEPYVHVSEDPYERMFAAFDQAFSNRSIPMLPDSQTQVNYNDVYRSHRGCAQLIVGTVYGVLMLYPNSGSKLGLSYRHLVLEAPSTLRVYLGLLSLFNPDSPKNMKHVLRPEDEQAVVRIFGNGDGIADVQLSTFALWAHGPKNRKVEEIVFPNPFAGTQNS